jgi:hypothetical protein
VIDGEKSLLKWIEDWSKLLPTADSIKSYEEWLVKQFLETENIIPVRLSSGNLPKGKEFLNNKIVFYGADNEPLASLIGFVLKHNCAPEYSLKTLINKGMIKASWPPKIKPTFKAKWGPFQLKLKDDGYKIAHLFDAGKFDSGTKVNDFHDPKNLKIRAHRTMSLINFFPFPNSSRHRFEVNGKATGDMAENREFQSVLLSFMSEYINDPEMFKSFLACCGEPAFPIDMNWKKRAENILLKVIPKCRTSRSLKEISEAEKFKKPSSEKKGQKNPLAFVPDEEPYQDLWSLVEALKKWRKNFPKATRLDGGPPPKSNRNRVVSFTLNHLQNSQFSLPRPQRGGSLGPNDFIGTFRLNGDTKAAAIDRLIQMAENECELDCILEPDLTRPQRKPRESNNWVGENPRFIIAGEEKADGLYCYPK